MSKNKNELLSKLNELIEKHGFVADKETLGKSIKEYDVSSITDEELIKRCQAVALTIYGTGKKGFDLIYELAGRYKNVILSKEAKEYLTDTKSDTTEDSEYNLTISTAKGDIPIKVIKLGAYDYKTLMDVLWDKYSNNN